MMAERAKLFEEVQEPDLSRFTPRTDAAPAAAIEQVRDVSTAAGFPSRDPVRPPPLVRQVAPVATPLLPNRSRHPVQYEGQGRDEGCFHCDSN